MGVRYLWQGFRVETTAEETSRHAREEDGAEVVKDVFVSLLL